MNAQPPSQKISLEKELQRSYLDYAMSVIVGRALPDVRDGLKPVQRRSLYGMHVMGNAWNKPYKKSAKVVGHVQGSYHPHGDAAVYDTIVRLAQPFTMRYVLVDGQGNFGSVDGDAPAAMRYTEIRLKPLSHELMADLDKDTVNFVPNYDNTEVIPEVFPTRFPNLLVNGASGIAVGMATNIPPHHLGEIMQGLIRLVDQPDLSLDELLQIIPGPDFPTGAIINGTQGIREAYETGRGKFYLRARCSIEPLEGDRSSIVIHEMPYQVNKARLVEKIAQLVRDKKIETISAIRDESDREGMRVVIEIKRGENADVTLNQLYAQTPMQSSFGMNMVALDGQQPRLMPLMDILQAFLAHRQVVVRRRTLHELKKALERAHILEGLAVAISHLDELVETIKRSANAKAATEALLAITWSLQDAQVILQAAAYCRPEKLPPEYGVIGDKAYRLSPEQVSAILEMRLHRLTGLEREKIINEYQECLARVKELREILASYARLMQIIRQEFVEIAERFTDERQTEISHARVDLGDLDMIPNDPVLVTISSEGYVKSQMLDEYRTQRRGGRGKSSAQMKEADFVRYIYLANRHDCLLCFTSMGRCYWLNVYEIPLTSRISRGRPLVTFLSLLPDEEVSTILPVSDFTASKALVMVTQQAVVKKVSIRDFSNRRNNGVIACDLSAGDRLVGVLPCEPDDDILMFSNAGKVIRFAENSVRVMGRKARGVRGMRLSEGQKIISVLVANEEAEVLTVSAKGFGKRTQLADIRKTHRSGQGVAAMNITEKTGALVCAENVSPSDDLVLISNLGTLVRVPVEEICSIGRVTQGVKLMNLSDSESIIDLQRIQELLDQEEDGD